MHQIRQNTRPTIRERRGKREPRVARSSIERCDRRARSSDNRAARRSTSALVGRVPLVDRWAARSSNERRAHSSIAIVDCRSRRSIDDRDRASRRSSARCDRRTSGAIVGAARCDRPSLSDLGSLFSLSLSLSGSELKWKWGEKFISGSKVKFVVNRKSFFGK